MTVTRFSTGLFAHHLRGAAIAANTLSATYKNRLNPFGSDIVAVAGDSYSVAHADTNVAHGSATLFVSEAAAREHLSQIASADPEMARSLHVIPTYELAA